MIKAVRGAISINNNDHQAMEEAVLELISEMIERNSIVEEEIISIIFSQTKDLTVANPAAALRVSGKFSAVPLFCTSEPEYEKSIDSIVRVLMTFNKNDFGNISPVYLGKASVLRKDLSDQ